ncbi:uncharacterized protein LOC110013345 [Oryzias latipes]|uniref:uncharacterized protein LOC110013345 n=1 Tax=Oryzias latipes TaxID=8090 RepID=UPI0009D9BA58|nr:uncharacterized protein LOC110013345 [Oryzias latipes]
MAGNSWPRSTWSAVGVRRRSGGWSQGIIRQLAPTHSCQFPAVLTYKLSCDQMVVAQLRSHTLGDSANRLYNTLQEQHSDSWMRRATHYLGVCKQFLALNIVGGQFQPPPPMPPLPSPVWLLTVYGYDVLTRLDEYKARITSTFGSILKMDSTKKVWECFLLWILKQKSGGSCLVVRLDIWYLMRRFASGVTTESHQLHPTFMRQLSHCIFQVDPGGARP